MPSLCAPVKFLVLPAVYDNVDTGVHHQEQMGEVSKKVRPEQDYYRQISKRLFRNGKDGEEIRFDSKRAHSASSLGEQ